MRVFKFILQEKTYTPPDYKLFLTVCYVHFITIKRLSNVIKNLIMNLLIIHTFFNVIMHMKNEITTSSHSIAAIAVAYITVIVVTLKIFHVTRDRNAD